MAQHEWLTIDEVAAILRVNRNTAYEAVRRKQIKAKRVGRTLRVHWSEVCPRALPGALQGPSIGPPAASSLSSDSVTRCEDGRGSEDASPMGVVG